MPRELYITEDTIESKTAEWLRKIEKYMRFRYGKPRLSETAILIIDLQRIFLEPNYSAYIPSAKAILPNILQLARLKNKGYFVISTRHIEKNDDFESPMMRWWGNVITDNTVESEIIPQLAEMNLTVLNKSTYDAFYNTELETLLRTRNIKWVIVTGVMTDLCCETTARSAFLRGFMPIVVADATATKTEELHISALMTLANGFAEISTTKKILEDFKCQTF